MRVDWGIVVRLILAAALLWVAWRVGGPVGVVFASVGVGALLAGPLMSMVSGSIGLARQAAYRDVEGMHFAYHGAPIEIAEDDDGQRWLRIAHVRRVVPGYPRDAALQRRDPQRIAVPSGRQGLHVRADALLEQLQPAADERTQRFRTWVEREVWFPSPAHRRTRGGQGRVAGDDGNRR